MVLAISAAIVFVLKVSGSTKAAPAPKEAVTQTAATQETAAQTAATPAREPISFRWKRVKWLLPYILWPVAIMSVIAGGLLLLYGTGQLAWLTSSLPSGGSAGWKASESRLLPERVAVWVTPESVAMILALVVMAIILAVANKAGWKRAAMLAAVLTLVVLAAIYHVAVMATIQDAPAQAVRLKDWALPNLVWALMWAVLISLVLAGAIGLWQSNAPLKEKLAGAAALALIFVIGERILENPDKFWQGYEGKAPKAVAATALPHNTSRSCKGVPMRASLGPAFTEINPYGCFSYWKVDRGRVILSGTVTEKEVGPEGGNLEGWVFYRARAKNGFAQMSYINCAGPKRDMATVDCR